MLTHHPPRKAFLQPQIFITLENTSGHEPSDCRLALLTAPHPTPASWGWRCVHSWEKWVTRVPRPVDGRVSPLLRLIQGVLKVEDPPRTPTVSVPSSLATNLQSFHFGPG